MKTRKNITQNIFCTYFDKNYLLKGLSMYFSLIEHNPTAILWILPMDIETKRILTKMKFRNLVLIDKKDFEDEKLLEAKKNRSKVEYLWTCTPSLPLYILRKNKNAQYVTYLDADLYFYSSIDPVYEEFKDGLIYTVEHRYPKGEEYRNNTSGRFNVAFQIFKRSKESMECLKRWREQCISWCYWKVEDGKLGDQLYLNEWPNLYKGLVISKNLGVDAAPWNIKQYDVIKKDNNVFINKDRLICYHFHQFEIIKKGNFNRSFGYNLSKEVIDYIYKPYEEEIDKNIDLLLKFDPSFKIKRADVKFEQRIKAKIAKLIGPTYWKVRNLVWQEKKKV